MFFETSRVYYDQHIVIHSTPVWVLAELGLIGFVVLSVIAINILNLLSCLIKKKPENACLLIIMVHFLVFGLVHEIFSQRIFWLAIGLCLAVPLNQRKPVKFQQYIQTRALCYPAISYLMLQNINDTSELIDDQIVTK